MSALSATCLSRRTFGALLLGSGAVGAVPLLSAGCASHGTRTDGMPRSKPSEQGVDAHALLGFLDEAGASGIELHSLMLYRHGHVVAEGWWWPYRADRRHMMHSLTKSVTACGVGLAIEEGRFALDDQVVTFFEDELPAAPDALLASMTVRHLLTMQTGHARGVSGSVWRQVATSWVTEFFKLPVANPPGTAFVYNSAASFMLSALITKTSGQTLREYLEPRFFRPLGIADVAWDVGPGGINPGGNGLSWTSPDSLKLGIVHLQGGRWQGRQVLPARWVRAATSAQVPSGRYGYQWWIAPDNRAYYAAGLFGQFSFVFPEHDAVLAITAGTDDEALLELVWRYFPTAFGAAPANGVGDAMLDRRCAQLAVLGSLEPGDSLLTRRISARSFQMQPNEDGVISVRFEFTDASCLFWLRDARGEHSIEVGLRNWVESRTSMSGARLHHQYQPPSMRVVAGGRWLDERTFEMTWQFVETAFQDRVVCRFDGDSLTLERDVNVDPAATLRSRLTGRLSRAAAGS